MDLRESTHTRFGKTPGGVITYSMYQVLQTVLGLTLIELPAAFTHCAFTAWIVGGRVQRWLHIVWLFIQRNSVSQLLNCKHLKAAK